MMVLSFPIGLIVAFLINFSLMVAYHLAGVVAPGGAISNIIFWAIVVPIGYWQWFILPDYLKKRFGKKVNNLAEDNI